MDNILKKDSFKKLKIRKGKKADVSSKRKVFVLYGDTSTQPAALVYYDSLRQFNRNCPKKRMILSKCFCIKKKEYGRFPYVITLYMQNDFLGMVLDTEEQLEEWLRVLQSYQGHKEVDYLEVWDVEVLNQDLATEKGIHGPYWYCLAEKSITLLQMTASDSPSKWKFPFGVIRYIIVHQGSQFIMIMGRQAITGEGKICMQTDDTVTAKDMQETVMSAIKRRKSGSRRPHNSERRSECENPAPRKRTVSESYPHKPSANNEAHQNMDSGSGSWDSGLHRCLPKVLQEEDYLSMEKDSAHTPQDYQNFASKSMAVPIDRTTSPAGSYSLSTSHGSCGSEVPELVSPIGSTPPDDFRNRTSSRSSVTGSICHSRTSSFNDEYCHMNSQDMSPLTQNIPKLKSSMSDDSYIEASPTSSCSLTSGTPSTDCKLSSTADSEYLGERVGRCYSVGSKPETYKKSSRLEAALQIIPTSRLRAFSVGSKKSPSVSSSSERSPSLRGLAVNPSGGTLSSSWSGPCEKGSFLKNFFRKSEKGGDFAQVEFGSLKRNGGNSSSDKLNQSTDSLRKRNSNRQRTNSRPFSIRPSGLGSLRKPSMESLSSRSKSPVKEEELLFGPADEELEDDYIKVSPPQQKNTYSGYMPMDIPKKPRDEYVLMDTDDYYVSMNNKSNSPRTTDGMKSKITQDYYVSLPGKTSEQYASMSMASKPSHQYTSVQPKPMSRASKPYHEDGYMSMNIKPNVQQDDEYVSMLTTKTRNLDIGTPTNLKFKSPQDEESYVVMSPGDSNTKTRLNSDTLVSPSVLQPSPTDYMNMGFGVKKMKPLSGPKKHKDISETSSNPTCSTNTPSSNVQSSIHGDYIEEEKVPIDATGGSVKITDKETVNAERKKATEALRTLDKEGKKLKKSTSICVPVSVAKKVSLVKTPSEETPSKLVSKLKTSPKKQSSKRNSQDLDKARPLRQNSDSALKSSWFSISKAKLEKQISVPNGGCKKGEDTRLRHFSASSITAVPNSTVVSSYSSPSSAKTSPTSSLNSFQNLHYIKVDLPQTDSNIINDCCRKSRNPSGNIIESPKYATIVFDQSELQVTSRH